MEIGVSLRWYGEKGGVIGAKAGAGRGLHWTANSEAFYATEAQNTLATNHGRWVG